MKARLLLATVLSASLCPPAHAWHNEGHMAVARIAWEQLSDGDRARAVQILQALPHKDAFLEGKPAGVTDPVWLFCKAATFPDWVRDPFSPQLTAQQKKDIAHAYNRPGRHFVNLPFAHPSDAGGFDIAALRQQVLVPDFDATGEPRHALSALRKALDQVKDATAAPADRAVSLAW